MMGVRFAVTWIRGCTNTLGLKLSEPPNQCLDNKKAKQKRKSLRYFVPSCEAFIFNVLMKGSASGVASKLALVWCYVIEKKESPWGCIMNMALPCLKLHIRPSKSSKGYTIKKRVCSFLKRKKIMLFLSSIETQVSSYSKFVD